MNDLDFTFFNTIQKQRKTTLSTCMKTQIMRLVYGGKNDFRSIRALVRRGLATINAHGNVYLTSLGKKILATGL